MSTIAIMQPYFLPYAGYFRLFAAADLVVLYDCVQFPRRGWVHRNRLLDGEARPRWLTLPLVRASRMARIKDLAFAEDARDRLQAEMRRFPACTGTEELIAEMQDLEDSPVGYLERLLQCACRALQLPFRTIRSSVLEIDPALSAQDRILAIAERLGATRYLNVPGGRALYDPEAFSRRGIELAFLDEYRGSPLSIAQRLIEEPAEAIAADIRAQSSI